MRRLLPFLLLLLLPLSGCDLFDDHGDGFDGNWDPDHTEGSDATDDSDRDDPPTTDATGSLSDDPDAWESDRGDRLVSARRPSDILADTATQVTQNGRWEKEGSSGSDFIIYGSPESPDLIVEELQDRMRSYYFNDGYLFYYTEESTDGTESLTVEFDDLGDIRGSQKLVNGQRVRLDFEDFSAIVEHAAELRMQN